MRFRTRSKRRTSGCSPVAGGLIIILDETEAIANDEGFAGFVKSLVEVLQARKLGSIQFVVTATPEGRDKLSEAHASFVRLFRPLQIDRLSDSEVAELVQRALDEGVPRKTATAAFQTRLAHVCSGIPGFVHEVGRAAFEVDRDEVLDENDLVSAVIGTDDVVGAMAVLEQKHFRERYSKKILSNTYREILHAIASFDEDEVSIEQIRERRPDIPQVSPYLANMAKRGVLVRVEGKKGVYRLPDRMFKVFLRMAGQRARGR